MGNVGRGTGNGCNAFRTLHLRYATFLRKAMPDAERRTITMLLDTLAMEERGIPLVDALDVIAEPVSQELHEIDGDHRLPCFELAFDLQHLLRECAVFRLVG